MLGFVTLPDLLAAGPRSGSGMTVAEIMVPLVVSEGVPPEMPLLEVLERMDDLGVNRLPVVEAGILRGVLSREDVHRRTALYLQLGGRP
ncbi:MAG TPA: CBS domain-containing protein [Planctomycetota bacterium]|nr:CBS domain-containing protein [Planctomycetota bacterium]